MMTKSSVLVCLLVALSACAAGDDRSTASLMDPARAASVDAPTAQGGAGEDSLDDGNSGSGDSGVEENIPGPSNGSGCDKMDVLFVIDNSGSMSEEQTNLAANFPRFMQVLDAFEGGNLDYRVGVTTTSFSSSFFGIKVDSGEEGALLRTEAMPHPWLARSDADASATFTKLATVGVAGSAQEQPLAAAAAAVTDRVEDGSNAGFLRDDALLALVFLTDEDDQSEAKSMGFPSIPGTSTRPVADFVTAFDEVAGDRKRWAAAVIAGDTQPSCSSQFGDAQYAERLLDFVSQTGENAVFSSICEGDLSKAVEDALNTFTLACDKFVVE